MASQEGHVDVARLLVDSGADIDKAANNGLTSLMSASGLGQWMWLGYWWTVVLISTRPWRMETLL